MEAKVKEWEQKAKVCLVDPQHDRDVFASALDALERELKELGDVWMSSAIHFDRARDCLQDEGGRKFICMFVWDFHHQVFFPVSTGLFDESETEVLIEIIKEFMQFAFDCCSAGFEVVTFNDNNKLLALAMQLLCESQTPLEINRKIAN